MGQGIFLVKPDGSLLQLDQNAYESEIFLQNLLSKYPNLLTNDKSDEENLTRWILVKQEMGVPDSEFSGNRWSLDHLFLDQNGIPTLVEVKRASDTRIRREVVGQMLDYAANAMSYWPIEKIQDITEATAIRNSQDLSILLKDLLDDETCIEEYWKRVETNLRSGRIRLIFVADEIPRELRRIIEFLNQQMDPAEIYGIEVKQFTGEGIRFLVPRVVGITAEAEIRKSTGNLESKQWDEEMFLDTLRGRGNENEVQNTRIILKWAKERNLRFWWGKGSKAGSFYLMKDVGDEKIYTFDVTTGYSKGYIQLQFRYFKEPFDGYEKKREFANKIAEVSGELIPDEKLEKFPSVQLSGMDDLKIRRFLELFDDYLAKTEEFYKD